MTLIKEIIQINGGYTDVVDLTNHYLTPGNKQWFDGEVQTY